MPSLAPSSAPPRGTHLPRLRGQLDRPEPVLLVLARPSPWTLLHPTHNPALKEEAPPETALHATAALTQGTPRPAQHHPDTQQEPREPTGQPYRGRAHQQVGHFLFWQGGALNDTAT